MNAAFGVITGTGFYTFENFKDVESKTVHTPYGDVNVELGTLNGHLIALIPRHGKGHNIAPADIDYRANLYAFQQLGVRRILATSVSGSLVEEWGPGTMILVDQFLNFTSGRQDTFYPLDGKLAHVDVTDPYCPTLSQAIADAANTLQIPMVSGGTYACFDGPRFETRAEIEMVRRLGGHLVGQTNYPECVLARELAMCYTTIGVISNHAAGMQSSLTVDEVINNLNSCRTQLADLFEKAITQTVDASEPYDCSCNHALDEAFI